MIITKTEPFTKEEIEKLKEQFEVYIKTVIDVENKICSAGMDRHFEGEEILLGQGSKQSNIWGGGIDTETTVIDFNSFINIRPNDNNTSNEIQDSKIRVEYERLTKYFLKICMNNQRATIGALAMDLKRVSLGLYNKSEKVANRFLEEAKKRKSEIEIKNTPPYISNVLNNFENTKDFEKLLMYSILLQNYSYHGK